MPGYCGKVKNLHVIPAQAGIQFFEFGSERIPRGSLRGKRVNDERCYSLRIEDSPQLAAEGFNYKTHTYEEEK